MAAAGIDSAATAEIIAKGGHEEKYRLLRDCPADALRPRALDGGGLDLVGLRVRHDPADVVARVLDQRLCRDTFEVEQDESGGVGPSRVYEVHGLAVLGKADGPAR